MDGIPDFMDGILDFMKNFIIAVYFIVVHRKVHWRNPKLKSLNSMPALCSRPEEIEDSKWRL